MNLSFFIARRYLFSKKNHQAINIVSLVSVFGVTVAVAALICTLSVYNGFQQLLGDIYSSFDPQIKIKVVDGKTFNPNTPGFEAVRHLEAVAVYSESLQENALIIYKEAQCSAIVKGVDDNFNKLTSVDSLMYAGQFTLHDTNFNYAILGVGLASTLGTGSSFIDPVTIHVPKRKATVNMMNPAASFKTERILIAGTFGINQPEYDDNYMLVPLAFARELFEYPQEVTSVELKLMKGASTKKTIKAIEELIGPGYTVQDIMEQKADFYRINRIEKWMTFLILSFILIIALFNVIGSLSLLIIEKKKDAHTLNKLGATPGTIQSIFKNEGRLIAFSGAILGLVLGSVACLVQQTFGLLKLGGGGNYIVDAYPVYLRLSDVFLVFITTLIISLPATWWPVKLYFKKNEWNHEA